ncbi:hypothetical protein KQX54_003407 [Cotesia glomerata]|uniref:Uncharacterized protein n=1 Tax=Cotesia glomerata TaxID=32391 RepID=A0AAV7J5U9_COTGL|nr:hypothetical protein KQX54_003407 [Cotesia glomerata]
MRNVGPGRVYSLERLAECSRPLGGGSAKQRYHRNSKKYLLKKTVKLPDDNRDDHDSTEEVSKEDVSAHVFENSKVGLRLRLLESCASVRDGERAWKNHLEGTAGHLASPPPSRLRGTTTAYCIVLYTYLSYM